jgi:hypothetical protein
VLLGPVEMVIKLVTISLVPIVTGLTMIRLDIVTDQMTI